MCVGERGREREGEGGTERKRARKRLRERKRKSEREREREREKEKEREKERGGVPRGTTRPPRDGGNRTMRCSKATVAVSLRVAGSRLVRRGGRSQQCGERARARTFLRRTRRDGRLNRGGSESTDRRVRDETARAPIISGRTGPSMRRHRTQRWRRQICFDLRLGIADKGAEFDLSHQPGRNPRHKAEHPRGFVRLTLQPGLLLSDPELDLRCRRHSSALFTTDPVLWAGFSPLLPGRPAAPNPARPEAQQHSNLDDSRLSICRTPTGRDLLLHRQD